MMKLYTLRKEPKESYIVVVTLTAESDVKTMFNSARESISGYGVGLT
jgi:hypothetical protein